MELRDFIQTSIQEIQEGVRAAADEDSAVAPASIEGKSIWTERPISFEADVTTDASAKSGLRVMQIAEAGGEVERTKANRISFSVPVHVNVRSGKEAPHA